MSNILITGRPGIGKTTLIMKIVRKLPCRVSGFYTREKRESGRRTGFYISDFSGNQTVMADVNFKSSYQVGKYGVNLKAFEKIAIPAMEKDADLIVVDEIGKMEIFSSKFRKTLEKIFNSSKPVLATIKERDCEFTSKLKARSDVKVFKLTPSNRDKVEKSVLHLLKMLF